MRTSSRCTAETVHGTHTFEVDGFSLHKGLGVDRFIGSAAFTVGGFDWCIRFYPDGRFLIGDGGDSFCICLELLSEKAEVRALYHLRLVHHAGAPWSVGWRDAPTLFTTMDASRYGSGWESYKSISRRDMEASGHIHDDRIVIECDITVIKEPQVAEAAAVVPPSDLSVSFGKLLESEEGADVKFIVQGEVFPAHKIVVATQSPVFKAQLYGPVGEGNRECIRLTSAVPQAVAPNRPRQSSGCLCLRPRQQYSQPTESPPATSELWMPPPHATEVSLTIEDMQAPVFKALLHFIYTDSLPAVEDIDSNEKEMMKHLLVAADRYAMERLKLICEGILCGSLDVETVATTLCLADQHNCTKLKDACIDYINSSDRINEVVASQGYLHLKTACPSVFVNMWEKEKVTKSQKN